jgi:uracil-DNA glycosylase family 4
MADGSKWLRLLDVYDEYADDPRFSKLRQPGIQLVRGDGPESAETARIFVVGEAPGAQENGQGRPFVGASGRVLNSMLNRAGLWRKDCFITNVVKYRPMVDGRNSAPALIEQIDSANYLRREWMIIRPALTIAVGAVAHNTLRGGGLSLSMTRRGELHYLGPQRVGEPRHWVTSQYHPAYGMRNTDIREESEENWDTLYMMLREVGGILCEWCNGEAAREGITCACAPSNGKAQKEQAPWD